MTRPRSIPFVALLALAAALAAGAARAGSDSDPHEHNPDEGPSYFGFVKDAGGVPVRDAKVSASYKNSLTLVTRTNATGSYRVNGFKKDVNPSDVTISCAKDGYKQVRVIRFPLPKGRPVTAVETECRLQRQ
jgi:Carboxypeptidase regulatory-like domain